MPIVNGVYQAPTWVNNGPPAMDATELQAMCNAIVQNQGDAAALQEALQQAVQSLTAMVNVRAQVQIVSYVGTGTYGKTNPCSITASFPIKSATVLGMLIQRTGKFYNVQESSNGSALSIVTSLLSGAYTNGLGFNQDMGQDSYGKISSNMKTYSWYSVADATYQLNEANIQYFVLCQG